MVTPVASFATYFNDLEDPRQPQGQLHLFFDILMIAICAVICGADSWVAVETFGRAKAEWFHTILKLPNGIPAHDTYRRLFMLLDKDAFSVCFTNWIQGIEQITSGQIIAIDGKTACASHGETKFTQATHMVSAWATTNGLVLGQVAVPDKTNEILAIPELLYLLNLTDCLVTIDDLGCQKEIAKQIVDQGGDYLLMAKGNQPYLHEDIAHLFDNGIATNFKSLDYGYVRQESQGHGRHEKRSCWTLSDRGWLTYLRGKRQWPKLTTIPSILLS